MWLHAPASSQARHSRWASWPHSVIRPGPRPIGLKGFLFLLYGAYNHQLLRRQLKTVLFPRMRHQFWRSLILLVWITFNKRHLLAVKSLAIEVQLVSSLSRVRQTHISWILSIEQIILTTMDQIAQALLFLIQLFIYIYFYRISSIVIWLWLSWIYEVHVHHRWILWKLYALLLILGALCFTSTFLLVLIKLPDAFLLFRVLKSLQFLIISWRSSIFFSNSMDVGVTIWKDSVAGYVLLWLVSLRFRTNWKSIDLIVSNWWVICCCFFLACVYFLDCAWSISVSLGDGVWLALPVLVVVHGHCSIHMSCIYSYDFIIWINLLTLIIWQDVVQILRILLTGIRSMRSILASWLRTMFGSDFIAGNWFLFRSDLVTGLSCSRSLLWALFWRWHTEITRCKAQLFHIEVLLIDLSCHWRILIFRNCTICRLSSFSVSILDATLNIWDIHWLLLGSGCWILALDSISELAIRHLFKLNKVSLLFQISLTVEVRAALSIMIICFIRICAFSVISAHLPSQMVHICRLVSIVFFFYRRHVVLLKNRLSCFFFWYWFTFECLQIYVSKIEALLVELIAF